MKIAKAFLIVLVGVILVVAIVVPIMLTLPEPSTPTPDSSTSDLVLTKGSEGYVVGVKTPEAGIFWGIPFSQPPTGNHRWKKPRNPVQYQSPYWNATYKRPGCIQICDQPVAEYSCPHATSEDCLYLNVWIPSKLLQQAKPNEIVNSAHSELDSDYLPGGPKDPLPVMVWFYGGNFLNGAGSCVLYDGRFMASKGDVIVVTTNYRVAHLGFLVQGTDEVESKGNFGLWDQVQTLEWVKKNIAMFGGDPGQVTIFGQSAGAESIGIHLTSTISDSLFHKAIMHSNPFGLPFRNLTDAKEFGGIFAKAANCSPNDMACLRSRTLKELEKAFNETQLALTDPSRLTLLFQPWGPVIDEDVVPEQPIKTFMKKQEQQKPMLMGATVDEGMIFVAQAFPQPMNSTLYNALTLAVFKKDYLSVISQYPPCTETECDNRDLVNNLATDYLFQCPQRLAVNSTLSDRWLYKFNETWSFCFAWEEPLCFDKVCHAAELAYVFGVENLTTLSYTDEERELSDRLIAYWSNFVKYGDPNQRDNMIRNVIHWPKFEWGNLEEGYKAMELRAEADVVVKNPYQDICEFWDNVDAYAEHY